MALETRSGGKKKLKVGVFSFTGDEGCVIVFTELLNEYFFKWRDLVEFRYARVIQQKNVVKDIDVAFVEGAISGFKEEKMLRKIRRNSKRVVAIGSCAIDGSPSNHRNFFDEQTTKEILPILNKFPYRKKVSPLHEIIKVDETVPGCPIVEESFLNILNKYLLEFGIISDGR